MRDLIKHNPIHRNKYIELLRVCCIFLVILTHVLNKNYLDADGNMRDAVCFLNSFCIVAVPIFFMITGFFSDISQDPVKKIIKMVKGVLIPTLIAVFMYQYFAAWANGARTIRDIFCSVDYQNIYQQIVTWKLEKLPGCGPFWYSTTYVKLIILFPVFRLLCDKTKEAACARYCVYGLCFLKFLWADINEFVVIPGSMYSLFDRSMLYFLLGYEARNINWERISISILMSGFIGGCAAMYGLTKLQIICTGEFSDYFFHYSTIPCVIASVSAFGIMQKLRFPAFGNRGTDIIIYLGKNTFYVYLIHNIVLLVLMRSSWFHNASTILLVLFAVGIMVVSFGIAGSIDILVKGTKTLILKMTSICKVCK